MMQPYTITTDPAARMLRASLTTFWDDATAQRFAYELERAAMAIRRPGKPSFWLIDTEGGPPQSQATTALLRETVARLSQGNFSYVAVVAPSAIVAMQARRVGAEGHETFGDRPAAEAWLAERQAASAEA